MSDPVNNLLLRRVKFMKIIMSMVEMLYVARRNYPGVADFLCKVI